MNDRKLNKKWLNKERFPRTSRYDLEWILANEMGPNALWLLEDLTSKMSLDSGMKVLDMGCGRALTSVFLARECGVKVWANDLWVSADDNWTRVVEAGSGEQVCPIQAEARNLPYAAGFFDAVVSIDSYQYFGTDDLYLGYITRFLRNGGLLGLVMPAMKQEFTQPPEHLAKVRESGTAFWDPSECWCLHTLEWWKRHLERSGLVDIELASYVEDGWKLWRDWELIRDGGGFTGFPSDAETLEEDGGRYIGFVMLVLKKRPRDPSSFDHSIKIRL